MAESTDPAATDFLVRLPTGSGVALARSSGRSKIRAAGVQFELEPVFAVPARPGAPGTVGIAGSGWEWHLARTAATPDARSAWDAAHALTQAAGLAAGGPVLVEPDLLQEWPYENPLVRTAEGPTSRGTGAPGLSAAPDVCAFNDQDARLPRVEQAFAWHLGDEFSQLRRARQAAATATAATGGPRTVIRVGHLDTGYDPAHRAVPAHIRTDLQRNFVGDQAADDAHDPAVRGPGNNPGHGTGTLSILAGSRFTYRRDGYDFDDVLGGAPDAEIVPIRVGTSVVQLKTSTVARGIMYAVDLCANEATRIHVLSMSMGGVASAAWADAVNLAYEAGILFVAAAGNNFSAGFFGFPTHAIVYPARFRRVVAACGVMANRKPYYNLPFRTMQGNWGPAGKMATAVSAFTPNMPWAELGCAGVVDMDGAGTSSATPQVAAAAALYLQRHADVLFDRARYPEPWMRVEAVRQALFLSAEKSADGGSAEKLGNGILRAEAALSVAPPAHQLLHKSSPDGATFPVWRVLTGLGAAPTDQADAMLALEATQLAHRWHRDDRPNPLEGAVADPDVSADAIPPAQVRRLLDALLDHPEASAALRRRAQEVRSTLFGPAGHVDDHPTGPTTRPPRKPSGKPPRKPSRPSPEPVVVAPRPTTATPLPFAPARPAFRCLRAYSIDPSLTLQLETAPISEITFKIPWEELQPGPVGEYLEVIDVDPASGCFYEPVNLDDPKLLAQDGLAPSEGTPQFHQQMVYAIASLTIRNFEKALGRRSLWRPGPPLPGTHPSNDSHFVQRLRIYPHALREENAYYSPAKVALMFGYFKAIDNEVMDHVPGGMVFTCLSHDIVAHETTHALLDGMHRRFLTPSNPDVLAFHEAFADIVALLQHFTFDEILRHQIAATRGDIRSQQSLLGQLAGEFGRATGMRAALRDAIGTIDPETGAWRPQKPDPSAYARTTEPHARGAILVAAVFDAFLNIYERRVADLLRLATGGTGILQPGAIHPDLVTRLASEAAKAAHHVLIMCIRALDYCPPVDITFGEFLRAIITADTDAVADDDLRYRVAFVEAFRKWGIYPRDLRTLSEDSLLWRSPQTDESRPSPALQNGLERVRGYAQQFLFAQGGDDVPEPREQVFHLQRGMRRELHDWLANHFATHPDGVNDARFLGLEPTLPFEVHTARFALRPSPDGYIDPQFLVGLVQQRPEPLDPARPDGERIMFEGGATIVADLRRLKVRYCIRKRMTSTTRLQRQQAFAASRVESGRATYLGAHGVLHGAEPFAALHRAPGADEREFSGEAR